MPQLGRLSSNSLSGITPSSGTPPPPPLSQFSNLTWTSYSRPTVSGSNVSMPVKVGSDIYWNFAGSSDTVNPKNSILKLSGGVVSYVTLPTPSPGIGNCLCPRVVYGNNIILVSGYHIPSLIHPRCIWKSIDQGATWTITEYPNGITGNGAADTFGLFTYANGQFFAFFRSGSGPNYTQTFCTSTDGVTWSAPSTVVNRLAADSDNFTNSVVSPDGSYILNTQSVNTAYVKFETTSPYSSFNYTASLCPRRPPVWVPELNSYISVIPGQNNAARILSASSLAAGGPWASFPALTNQTNYLATAVVPGFNTVIYATPWLTSGVSSISYDAGSTFLNYTFPSTTAVQIPRFLDGNFYSGGGSDPTLWVGTLS